MILPALRKIRGRPAEDPRRTSAEGIRLGTHGRENHEFCLRSFEEGCKHMLGYASYMLAHTSMCLCMLAYTGTACQPATVQSDPK